MNIKAQESIYKTLVEENAAGLFHLENDIITYANRSFSEVVRVSLNELIGTSIYDYILPDEKNILIEAIEKIKKGKLEKFNYDFKLNHDADEVIYFSMHLTPYTQSKEVTSIVGASRDATSRAMKNIEMLKAKSRFEALFRNMIDGILIYNYAEEKILDCNETALEMFGYEDYEAISKINRFDFIPKKSHFFPDMDLHEATKGHGQRVMNGEAFHTPGIINHKSGVQKIVSGNVVPTFHQYGEAFVIFHDITKRVLDKRTKQQTEKRYKDIFQNSHEAIIYIDPESMRPILCNPNALELMGVSSFEELVQLSIDDVLPENSPDKVYLIKSIQKALKEGKCEVSLTLKKQNQKSMRVSGMFVSDLSDKKNPKFIAFLRDVTTLYEAQEAIKNKNQELEKYIESNLQLENFAYFASHDLQTPLRSITSFTQLLERRLKDRISEEEKEFMSFITSSAINMQNLINDLLSYSRTNTTAINITEVSVKMLLEQLFIEMSSTIEEKQAEIIMHPFPESIGLDETKIRQVFQNLITNALKFSKPDQRPKIVISCQNKRNEWVFSIEDNGIGIKQEFQEKIFLLFKRLHTSQEYEGTGIGLAMVKKIISQHKGRIWLKSEYDKGSTFFFSINKKLS